MGNKADNGKTECNKIKHGEAKDEKKVPKLRFPGFSGEWKERKLGEVYKVNNERNEGQYPVEKTLSIATMTFNKQGNGADVSSLAKYKVLRIGDLAFEGHTNKDFLYGRFVLNNLEAGIISPRFTALRPIIQQNFNFWEYYIHSERVMRRKLVNATKAGTMMNELVLKDFFCQTILMPSIAEQTKIGAYLKQLDNLITRHQQKLEHLEDLKKGMLQKMFPKEGETVPEVRFPGFTGKWERRKLGDCFSERQERSADGELISVTINDGVKKFTELDRHDNSSEDKSKYKCVEIGDIAYNTMRMWQGASGISPYKGILSPAYTVLIPEDGIDSLFFSYVFKLENMLYKFQVNSQGLTSDTWNLKYNAFSGIETMVPSLEEQEKIAAYFRNFDNLITLHKHRLEHLKELKKGLLQQMFV